MKSVGVVVIGRNEGDRLRTCLRSITDHQLPCVYVDSASTDGSPELATRMGVTVVSFDPGQSFTAGMARNIGFASLMEKYPDLEFVQFVDGDCQLAPDWLSHAVPVMLLHGDVAVSCGRTREQFVDRSIYNRLCDLEWNCPPGETNACGGIALMRVGSFRAVQGFRKDLIAGEEPELCHRLRRQGYRIVRLPFEMTLHDAAMSRFGQWWRRAVRGGHAFAEVATLTGHDEFPLWRREHRSIWFWGLLFPLTCILLTPITSGWSLLLLLAYFGLALKIALGELRRFGWVNAFLYAGFCVLAKIPQMQGAMRYHWNRLRRKRSSIIEYKDTKTSHRVAYLINQYPQVSHSFIRREIQALERQGVKVDRVSLRWQGNLIDPGDVQESKKTWVLQNSPISYIILSVVSSLWYPVPLFRALCMAFKMGRRSHNGLLKHGAYLLEAFVLKRRLRDRDISHVHAHFGTNAAAIVLLTRLLGGPSYSFTVHGPEEFDSPLALSLDLKIHHAEFVVAISEFCRSQLYRWCAPEEWNKVKLVHCGVSSEFLAEVVTPIDTAPHFVSVGRLCEQKGQMILLQAAARLKEKGRLFKLRLIGDGPMRKTLEQAVERLHLEEEVLILGAQPQDRVREEILQARAMVLPSFAEGLPVVLMECLALGRPVVTTHVAGIPELVQPQENGWLVPAGEVEALAVAMEAVLTSSVDRLEAMGASGRRRVEVKHDVAREAAKLNALFVLYSWKEVDNVVGLDLDGHVDRNRLSAAFDSVPGNLVGQTQQPFAVR